MIILNTTEINYHDIALKCAENLQAITSPLKNQKFSTDLISNDQDRELFNKINDQIKTLNDIKKNLIAELPSKDPKSTEKLLSSLGTQSFDCLELGYAIQQSYGSLIDIENSNDCLLAAKGKTKEQYSKIQNLFSLGTFQSSAALILQDSAKQLLDLRAELSREFNKLAVKA